MCHVVTVSTKETDLYFNQNKKYYQILVIPGNPSIYSYFDENLYQKQAVIAGCQGLVTMVNMIIWPLNPFITFLDNITHPERSIWQ